jgi:hypothetical protein
MFEREFEGLVISIGVNTFTLFGRTITTDENTEFRDASRTRISANTFFAQAVGKRVEVNVTQSNGIFLATRVELEDDDILDF